MAKVKFSGKEYDLRFNLAFWNKVGSKAGITAENLEKKLNEDMATNIAVVLLYGIYYGLPKDERPNTVEDLKVTIGLDEESIMEEFDSSVVDAIEDTVIDAMPRIQRETARKFIEKQQKDLQEFVDPGKKKSRSKSSSSSS